MALVSIGMMFAVNEAKGQVVQAGNVIIDPYYGGPNFGKTIAKSFEDDASSDVKVSGIGPMGIRAEYMVSDKIGLGVDFIYNSFNVQFEADSLNADGTLFRTFDVKPIMQRYRIQARFNYHFATTEKVDPYIGVGAGTNLRVWKVKTDYPNYEYNESGTLLPISMRVCIGTRYFFTNNIGIHGEIGIGGPVVSAGVSLKF